MSKFLNLCEEFDPSFEVDNKLKLVNFLKTKGITSNIIDNTDMIEIDMDGDTITLNLSQNDEDESIKAGFGDYNIDQEVEKLGSTASRGLKGIAAGIMGTAPQKAKKEVARRSKVAKQAVDAYEQATNRLEAGLRSARTLSTQSRVTT